MLLPTETRDLGRRTAALSLIAIALKSVKLNLVLQTPAAPLVKVVGAQGLAAIASVSAALMAAYFLLHVLHHWLADQTSNEIEWTHANKNSIETLDEGANERVGRNHSIQALTSRLILLFDVFLPVILATSALILLWSDVTRLPSLL